MPHKENTYAALDLGSNSFHLVIAKVENGRLLFLDRVKLIVRLANGLKSNGKLSKKAQRRAFEAFHFFEERLRGFHDLSVKVVGTNTLRAAKNSLKFLEIGEQKLGFPISIINGREEARLVFKGVTGNLPKIHKGRFVVDIGGGSTELIWGEDKPEVMESLHMGCVSFTRRFFPKGVITANNYANALLAAKLELTPIISIFKKHPPGQALGSSGTIKNIETVLDQLGYLQDGIGAEGLLRLSKKMIDCNKVKHLNLPGLKPERAPVFPGGVAILHAICEEIPLPPLQASPSALREGLLYEMIGRADHIDQRELTVREMMARYSVDPKQAARVEHLSMALLNQLQGKIEFHEAHSRRYLRWAAALHEMGLSISHSSYHKHGAYLIQHSDLPGFNRSEKQILSFLVGNHRRRIRLGEEYSHFSPPWPLLLVFRLACLFLRTRNETRVPPINLLHRPRRITVGIDAHWLEENPLTSKQLEIERKVWRETDREFIVLPK